MYCACSLSRHHFPCRSSLSYGWKLLMAALRWNSIGLLGLIFCLVALGSNIAVAQPKAAPGKEEPKLPEPEDINRESKDGVALKMTYYAGTQGKKSVPLILIHGWGGQRGDMSELALRLQTLGHACLSIDMRGHGQSLKLKATDAKGDVIFKDLDKEDFRQAGLISMGQDIETAKKFLLEKNNAGECNIEALGIVACDVMCITAMRWSMADWNVQSLPAFKQGQDVKALVLLSPVNSFKGYNAVDFITHPAAKKQLSIMLVAGMEDAKSLAEAKRLNSKLQPFHPKPSGDQDLDRKNLDLFLVTPETNLQGSKLLSRALPVSNNIANFLMLRLVDKQDQYIWSDRKSPL
jgi:pimeloyl-ACP methyl ester carboxylesterase